jgi:hypothetical protein
MLLSEFVRALEAEYDAALAAALAGGADAEQAHLFSLAHVKRQGALALEQLRRAGVVDWKRAAMADSAEKGRSQLRGDRG